MGIGVQGEAGGEIAEHTADGFDVNTVLESDGGEGMAEIVEPDLRYGGDRGTGPSEYLHAPEHA